jgi:hypothetical protein
LLQEDDEHVDGPVCLRQPHVRDALVIRDRKAIRIVAAVSRQFRRQRDARRHHALDASKETEMKVVSNTYQPGMDTTDTPARLDAPRSLPISNSRGPTAGDRGAHEPLAIPSSYAVERPAGALSPLMQQPNVYRDTDGNRYLHDGASWYPARYDADNGTLRVWQPDRAYKPQYPVRYDAEGRFTVHDNVGLKGGGLFGGDSASVPRFGEDRRIANRRALGTQLNAMSSASEPGNYANSVKVVNEGLAKLGVGLSDQAFGRISRNLERVQNGHMTNAEASSCEYRIFMNDARDPKLSTSDRAWSCAGAHLNRYAAAPFHAEADIANMHLNRNQDALTRLNMQVFVQNDPKG